MSMSSTPRSNGGIANRILRTLPKEEYEQLLPYLDPVRFPMGRVVHEAGQEMTHVYFPNHGVLSMLTVLDNGDLIEIATVGNEGMADLSVFLGLTISNSRLLVQIPGDTCASRSARSQIWSRNSTASGSRSVISWWPCLRSSPSRRPAIASIRSMSARPAGC